MPTLRLNRRAGLRLLLGGVGLALAACGRKGAPLPPYDVDPCYPRHYPMDQAAKDACAKKEEYVREHPPQPRPEKGKKQRDTTPPAQPPAAQPSAEPSAPAASPPSDQTPTAPAPTPPSSSQPQ